jgi:hypothetical protein
MDATRRDFVQRLAAGAVGLTGVSMIPTALPHELRPMAAQDTWDLSWTGKLRGKHKACFDCAEVESGYGVWRASAWAGQYMDVMKVPATDLSPLLILRHNAIALAMQQSFWDKYGIGKAKGVTHPLTGEPTDRNPALLDEKDGVPAPFSEAGLHKQIARGVVALACNLALQDCVELVKRTDRVSDDEARRRAVAALVPGVILQPSGVFAAVRAQEAGCSYVKSS